MTEPTAVPDPPGPGAGTTPAVVAVGVLGVLVSALSVLTVDRWQGSAPAGALAVLAVVTALTGVLTALGGHLLATLPWQPAVRTRRRGVVAVLLAGALTMVAVLLTGAAALVAAGTGAPGGATQPAMTVQVVDRSALSVRVVFPAVPAGEVLNATMVATDDIDPTQRSLLARSLVRSGRDGAAVADLAAQAGDAQRITVSAAVAGQSCTATFSVVDATAPPGLVCSG